MGTAPWRCSQCGTINEPVANSCRTCGKWPSLFDLEDSAVDEDLPFEHAVELEQDAYAQPAANQTVEAPEPRTVDIETFEPPEPAGMPGEARPPRRRFDPPPTDPVGKGESDGPRWISWIIPAALVVYFVVQFFISGR